MYLARFDGDTFSWLQGLANFPFITSDDEGRKLRGWNATLDRLIRAISLVPHIASALRVTLTEDRSLQRILFVCAPRENEADLRRYFARFTQMERARANGVVFPLSRQEHDALIGCFPRMSCRVALPTFTCNSLWFACDFQVFPLLNDLITEAESLGYELAYQVNVRPLSIDSEVIKEARKNVLRISASYGMPEEVMKSQQRVVNRLVGSCGLYEEFLGVETPEAADWLSGILQHHFRSAFGRLNFESPEFVFTDDGYRELIDSGLNSSMFASWTVDQICSHVIDDKLRASFLAWQPAKDVATLFANYGQTGIWEEDDQSFSLLGHTDNTLPAPYEGTGSYIFISYKHQDIDRILPMLIHLGAAGCNIWYDKGIPGGAEWDAIIEEKLEHSQCVILFVSQGAIQSKYCRREVKFADIINKPIVGILLEDVDLALGMKLLLTQYQMLDARGCDFWAQLNRAVDYADAGQDQ